MAITSVPSSIQPLSPRGAFANEPFENFKLPETERAIKAALEKVAGELGHEYELVIGGRRLKTEGKIRSTNPARPAQVVGIHQKAGAEHADQAVTAANTAFDSWSRTTVEERVSLLLHAAQIIRPGQSEAPRRSRPGALHAPRR